jgi:hypothetical protein
MTENYADMNDGQCVTAIIELRRERTTRDIARVRFVSRINRAGYGISTAEYSAMEDAPALGVQHVRNGILDAARKAFDPAMDLESGDPLIRATELMNQYRTEQGLSHDQIASKITEMGYRISRDQYRSIEQGMTHKVPYEVILYAAIYLGIPANVLDARLETY